MWPSRELWSQQPPDHRAGRFAAHRDERRATLRRHEQVSFLDTRGHELGRGEAKQAVAAGVRIAGGQPVGVVDSAAAGDHAGRHEPDAFDSDVAAGWQGGLCHQADHAARSDGVDLPLSSSGAISAPPNEPKVLGATASPPRGQARDRVRSAPCQLQSIAKTTVLPPVEPVTSSRDRTRRSCRTDSGERVDVIHVHEWTRLVAAAFTR